jgi:hypothetical protein
MSQQSRSITTPRADGATLAAAFTVGDVPEGLSCTFCGKHVGARQYHECWKPPQSASSATRIITGLQQAAMVERVRHELFPNLSHYRQQCINETSDAVEVVKFIEAEIFRRCFGQSA